MDRRAFLFSTAGLALAPGPQLYGPPGAVSGPVPPPLADPASFDAWRSGFIQQASSQGLDPARVEKELEGLTPDPHVLALDTRQPEFSKPISAYLAGAVTPGRIAQGQAKIAADSSWFASTERRYGAPAEVLVAIWGVESGFGKIQGDDDVVRSLATLAAEGRRKQFAEDELVGALRILESGEATRTQMVGSWAGAMGQTQFTPLDYLEYAVDGDEDGRRDIWGSSRDALASTANFLNRKGHWRPGEDDVYEVAVPRSGFDYSLIESTQKLPSEWAALGVRRVSDRASAPGDAAAPATLLMPMGWQGPGFLAFPNHMAIRAYNNSVAYALAVGLLAHRIAGSDPLVQPWPADQATSLQDRIAAQQALAKLGFDPGGVDGLLGTGTRKAARLWQASQGLPADGYLTYDLIQRLKAQAGVVAAPTFSGAAATA